VVGPERTPIPIPLPPRMGVVGVVGVGLEEGEDESEEGGEEEEEEEEEGRIILVILFVMRLFVIVLFVIKLFVKDIDALYSSSSGTRAVERRGVEELAGAKDNIGGAVVVVRIGIAGESGVKKRLGGMGGGS
jgi:hypothetical protein